MAEVQYVPTLVDDSFVCEWPAHSEYHEGKGCRILASYRIPRNLVLGAPDTLGDLPHFVCDAHHPSLVEDDYNV